MPNTYQTGVYRERGGNTQVYADDAVQAFGTGKDIQLTFDATNLIITGVPTSDPASAGALWNDSGTLKLSTGGGPS